MKAVYAAGTDYDNPLSQLKVGELDTPETKPFWSTIHVAAASVNHHDIWSLQGVGLSAEQTLMILGTDASGVLDEDIPVRKGLKAGAEVVLYTFVGTDGAGVMPGERRTILSEKYAGTMAETTQVPSANVFAKPANLTLDEAAALGTSWLTAYSLLFTSANVKPGDTVLIQGAGGAVIDHENRTVWIVAGTVANALIGKTVFEDPADLIQLAHDFRQCCPRSGISHGVQRRQSANFRSVSRSPNSCIERANRIFDRLLKGG